jgi:hypothetical protein
MLGPGLFSSLMVTGPPVPFVVFGYGSLIFKVRFASNKGAPMLIVPPASSTCKRSRFDDPTMNLGATSWIEILIHSPRISERLRAQVRPVFS